MSFRSPSRRATQHSAETATWHVAALLAPPSGRHGGLAAAPRRRRRLAARPGGGAAALLLRFRSCADQAACGELHRHARADGQHGLGDHAAHHRHQPWCEPAHLRRQQAASRASRGRAPRARRSVPLPRGRGGSRRPGDRARWLGGATSFCSLFALTCVLLRAQATRASLTSRGSCTSSAWASTVRPVPTRAHARAAAGALGKWDPSRPPRRCLALRRPLRPPSARSAA